MEMSIANLFSLYQLPTGRRSYALGRVAKYANELGDEVLERDVRLALRHEADVRVTERGWAANSKAETSSAAAELRDLDGDIDRALTALRDTAEARLRAVPRRERRTKGEPIERFLARCFPNGVAPMTMLSYPEEHEAVRALVTNLRKNEAEMVALLGLTPFLDTLQSLLPKYDAAIKRSNESEETVTYKDVLAVRARAHEEMCLIVAKILARHPSAEARRKLLEPILEQHAALADAYARRRGASDVHVETGEDLPPGPTSEATSPPPPSPATAEAPSEG
ncbi:MAG: hypothetical protein IPK13_25040 [Deltaproteobacteria bacterium]|nr:hypothetical protein [Deltaproteobacteria bacterium]